MGAKVYADRLSLDGEPAVEAAPSPAADPETERAVEAEVQAVAAWFEALPAEWRAYFDLEAQSGRRAYGPA
jgi:hypothetical protein